MCNITENNIKRWMKPKIYIEALELYEDDNVIDMQVNENHNKFYNANFVELNGKVKDLNGNIHKVLILFNDKTGINIIKCDCKKSKINDVCSHVGGILIKYVREKDIINDNSRDYFTQKFLGKLKANILRREGVGIPFYIEIKIHYFTDGLSRNYVDIKVGKEKLYIVKDIGKFLNAVSNNAGVELRGDFIYDPYKYYLKSEDEEVLNCLSEIYKDKCTRIAQGCGNITSGKKMYLSQADIKSVMKALQYKMFEFSINEEESFSANIINKFPPIDIKLEKNEDFVQLVLTKNIPNALTYDGEYTYYEEKIYKLNKYQRDVFKLLMEEFSESNNIIKFNKERLQEVLSYILPVLGELGIQENIDKKISKELYDEPLKPKVYIDKFGKGICVNIKFDYDNVDINGSKRIVIKDIILEINLVHILEKFGFKEAETGYVNNNLESIIHFMVHGIIEIQNKGCQVFYAEELKRFKVYSPSSYRGNIKLNDKDELEISFQIEGIDQHELKSVFEALEERKKYYELQDGEFVDLENKTIKSVRDMFRYLDVDPLKAAQTGAVVSKYNAMYVDKYVDEENLIFFNKNEKIKKVVNSLNSIEDIEIKLPREFEGVMREYQKKGFKWLKILDHFGFGGILADEMGLGKTIQAIALISSEIESKKPSIIIVPTSIVYNWEEEIRKFSPKLKVLIINGSKHEREKLIKSCLDYDVVITSYPLVRIDIENYINIQFKYCFLDEAQYIKNKASISAKAVKKIRSKNCFALTGTPIENSLSELWSIFDFIMPGYLLNHSKFVKNYEKPITRDKDSKAINELNRHIRPFILRRVKKNVVKELPSKIEHKILVDMTKKQKEIYYAYLKRGRNNIYKNIKNKGMNNSKFMILSLLTRLRQICSNPASFIENYSGENSKIDVLMDIVSDGIANGHRILVFSQFVSVLKVAADKLREKDIAYMYLDGNTGTKDRLELADRFNNGEGKVFLISLKAGGTGLNLVGADIVVHFDPWWNPAVEDQASDRAHRIGQKNNVEVIKFIARDTIEEKIYNLQRQKKKIVNKVFNDINYTDENMLLNLDEIKIREILD